MIFTFIITSSTVKSSCYNEESFDYLKYVCINIKIAAKLNPTECNSLSDLVWSTNDCARECPYCKCTTQNTQGELYETQSLYGGVYPSKMCTNCTCSAHLFDNNITDFVFQCASVLTVTLGSLSSIESEWKEFECPPMTCIDENEMKRQPTELWKVNNTNCDKYCYCHINGTIVCQTGWSNILSSNMFTINQLFSIIDYDRCSVLHVIDVK